MHEQLALEDAVSRVEGEVQAVGDKLAGAEHSAVDADDTGIRVEIPWTIVTGSATGRLDQVWRLRLNADSRPRVQPDPSVP
jgi:hypothetical protein